jgi:hypothetical protein
MPLSAFASEVEALARSVIRLSSRNPEHAHEDVSELRASLFGLAGRMRKSAPVPAEERAPRGRIEPGTLVIDRRHVRVEVRRKKAA